MQKLAIYTLLFALPILAYAGGGDLFIDQNDVLDGSAKFSEGTVVLPPEPSGTFGSVTQLSLGDALAAFGLIFAVYQLRNKQWEIVIALRPKYLRNLWWNLSLIGLGLALLSALLSSHINPLILEVPSFILLLAGPVSLYFLATKGLNKLFTVRSSRAFYSTILSYIARPSPEEMRACVNILLWNLEGIVRSLPGETDLASARYFKEDIKLKPHQEAALSIVQVILSEPAVVKYVITSRLDFLYTYIGLIKKHELGQQVALSMSHITQQLFDERDSYLYTQSKGGGFAMTGSIFERIFFDQYLLDRFTTLGNWWAHKYWSSNKERLLSKPYLEVYLAAMTEAIQGYFYDESHHSNDPRPLWVGFEHLDSYCVYLLSLKIKKDDAEWLDMSKRLHDIAGFFSDVVRIYEKAHKEKKVRYLDMSSPCEDTMQVSHVGFSSLFAQALYNFIAVLDGLDDDEDVGSLIRHATIYVYYERAKDIGLESTRNCLSKLLWEQIETNVDPGTYPNALRPYLSAYAGRLTAESSSGWEYEEQVRAVEFLEGKLKPKIHKKNERMINDQKMRSVLLPSNFRLTEVGVFEWKHVGSPWKPIRKPKIKPEISVGD